MRIRMRPAYTPAELGRIYAAPHNSDLWDDHRLRVEATIAAINAQVGTVKAAADLSCGNGRILDGVVAFIKWYGDYAPGWPIHGPIEQTLAELDPVDLLIMSETIEHLDDPDAVLALAREKTRVLVLSTPISEYERHGTENREHYWSWGLDDVHQMLARAGFIGGTMTWLPLGYYDFQLWIVR